MPFAQKASISFTSPILESLFYEFEKKKRKPTQEEIILLKQADFINAGRRH